MGHRVRRVTPGADGILNGGSDEIITTIAGTGRPESSGDGGPAVQANVAYPVRGAVDPEDNLYIFEALSGRLRKIDAATKAISTVKGPQAFPWSFTIPTSRDLFYATGNQFFRLDLLTHASTRIAGQAERGYSGDGGDALEAQFRGAQYFGMDAKGSFYFVDNGNFALRKISRPE